MSFTNLLSLIGLVDSKKLNNSQIEKIKEEMTKDFNSKINLSYKVDESLLAGVKIKIGSIVFGLEKPIKQVVPLHI